MCSWGTHLVHARVRARVTRLAAPRRLRGRASYVEPLGVRSVFGYPDTNRPCVPCVLRSDRPKQPGAVTDHELMVTSIQTRIEPRGDFPAASVDPTEAR